MQPPTESCKAFPGISPVCRLAERWCGVPGPFPAEKRMLSWPAALHQLQLCILAGKNTLIALLSKQEKKKKKQWKGSSSGAGLPPSFSVAEAGSPRAPLWHVPRAPLLLRHRVLGPAATSSAWAGRREEAAVLWLRSGSQTARTSLALQSIASVWGKLVPPGSRGKPVSPWFSYTYAMHQESLTKQKLTLPGRWKESHRDVQGKGLWRETRRALRSSEER